MNQPEGYVLVQIKQLAQWREWANNVAAWSKQADRSSEIARLKASISSAMISATLPPASAAGDSGVVEREMFEAWMQQEYPGVNLQRRADGLYWDNAPDPFWFGWQARADLATKPQAEQPATPPAQTVQDSAKEFAEWLLKHYIHTFIDKRNMDMFLRAFAARTRGDEVGKSS